MIDRVRLEHDLVESDGTVLAPAGFEVTTASIAEAARRAPPLERRALADTFAAAELSQPLTSQVYRHIFRTPSIRGAVARVLLAARLPDRIWAELAAMRDADPGRWRHAVATGCIAVRMLLASEADEATLAHAAVAGLLHDLGMRHVSRRSGRAGDALAPDDARAIAAHTVLGALHVAAVLGEDPAVEVALDHHWRRGQGPQLAGRPSWLASIVSVASAFVALTQPRVFRSSAYEARGAADILIREASDGLVDADAVKLLVHALRGGKGDARELRFGRERMGQSPAVNRHGTVVAPESRSGSS